MAIACSTSAFKIPLDEALGKVSGLGFECVDLIAIPSWVHIVPEDLADDWQGVIGEVEAMLDARGLTPVAVNCALPTIYDREDETVAERLRQARGLVRLMSRLDIGVASFYPGPRTEEKEWDQILEDAAKTWQELLDVADAGGVTFSVELHYGTPFQTVEQSEALLDAVPGLPVAYDPSHFVMQEIEPEATDSLLARAAHVHLRDAAPEKMQVPMGEGAVDFEWIVRTLSENGYEGHYSVEYLPDIEGGPEAQIAAVKERLERLLGG